MDGQKDFFFIIINDAPYGIERPYNALRLAIKLVKTKWREDADFSYG